MAEITHKELLKLRFKDCGWCNNRHFYKKGKFTVIEHNGIYSINYNSDEWHGKEYKTIEGLKNFMDRQKSKIKLQIRILKESLND